MFRKGYQLKTFNFGALANDGAFWLLHFEDLQHWGTSKKQGLSPWRPFQIQELLPLNLFNIKLIKN